MYVYVYIYIESFHNLESHSFCYCTKCIKLNFVQNFLMIIHNVLMSPLRRINILG